MTVDPKRVQAVFLAAVEAAPAADRAAVLDRECGADPELRKRVQALLQAHDEPDSLLDRSASAVGVTASAPRPANGRMGRTVDCAPPAEDVGSVIAGRYKLLQEIGEGGMGTVWMAEQTQPVRRQVAVKLIKPGMDSKAVLARFEAERQALALMDHPNIAKVLDGGTTDAGRPYFVMELVRGIPLTQYCDDRQLTVRQRLDLFVSVCSAVQHAHQKGIIHRDLKPSNVLVTEHDGTPVPKVIDFGLAKALHAAHALTDHTLFTAFGTVVGTPLYMAPEQVALNALDVDTRSDIYSLGVVLYELLTGTTPLEKKQFADAAWEEIRRLIREEEPPRPSTRLSTSHALPSIAARRQVEPAKLGRIVRGELDWIVMRALEKDRNRRYSTANAFARDVQRYLADEPVEACPPSAGYRVRKFARKYKAGLTAAAAIAALLMTGVAVTTWQAVRAVRAEALAVAARDAEMVERQEAERQRDRAAKAEADATRDRDKAVAEKKRADEEAATATAILEFVERDLFGAQRNVQAGEPGLRKNATLREALDAAEPKIGKAFSDRPVVEVRLRNMLTSSYWAVAELDLRKDQAQKAYDVSARKLGPDHPDTVLAELALIQAKDAPSRRGESIQSAEALLARLNRAAVRDYKLVARAQSALLSLYRSAGRPQDVLATSAALVDTAKRRYGPDHPNVLHSQVSLGVELRQHGSLDEATRLLEQTFKALAEKEGPDANWTLRAATFLAGCYTSADRYEVALPLMEQTYQKLLRSVGFFNDTTRQMQRGLPGAYLHVGRHGDAIRFLEEVLPPLRKKLGEFDFGVTAELINLANAYNQVGRHQDVVTLIEPAVAAFRGTDQEFLSGNFGLMVVNLTKAYAKVGRGADAAKLIVYQTERTRAKFGAANPGWPDFLANQGRRLVKFDRFQDAEPYLRELLATCEKAAADDWKTAEARSLLGAALAGQAKFAEAEPLLLQGYEGLKRQADIIPVAQKDRPAEALGRLVRLYEATNNADAAAKWRADSGWGDVLVLRADELAERGTRALDAGRPAEAEPPLRECLALREANRPDERKTSDARSLLGRAFADQKKYTEAEPLLLAGYAGIRQRPDKTANTLVSRYEAREWLVQLYEAWGKPDEAARWRKEAATGPGSP
ncbi:MAG: serine/threonine-protein kinase [Gemmataceae bacterium]